MPENALLFLSLDLWSRFFLFFSPLSFSIISVEPHLEVFISVPCNPSRGAVNRLAIIFWIKSHLQALRERSAACESSWLFQMLLIYGGFFHMLTPKSHFTARWCTVRPIKSEFWGCTSPLECAGSGCVSTPQITGLRSTITTLILCPELSKVPLYSKSHRF